VIVGDEDRVYRPGETFQVPAGTPHQMDTGEPTTMRWKVRRALRTAEF
jgi:quercetin dioxygenase-like cupin family protein